MRPDENDLFRDDLAERRRERDLEREPRRFRRIAPDNRQRWAFQSRMVDTSSVTVECPACLGPVCAPRSSNGERVDCVGCGAQLVTAQVDGQVTAILVRDGAP